MVLAARAYAGTTNFTVALPTASSGSSSIIWQAPILTNYPGNNVGVWTNVVDGPQNFFIVRFSGADCYFGVNISNASSLTTPIVQQNSVWNSNLMSPGVNITNLCAREVGTTGNATGHVWISWQEPNKNAGFPR